jgi:hypothetical protein
VIQVDVVDAHSKCKIVCSKYFFFVLFDYLLRFLFVMRINAHCFCAVFAVSYTLQLSTASQCVELDASTKKGVVAALQTHHGPAMLRGVTRPREREWRFV